jgi:hypothetical protein
MFSVSMDKRKTPECGKVVELGPSHEVNLQSNGLAPAGYCGVTVFTPREKDGYVCDAICVTYKKASIHSCQAKVKFVGHKFRKGGDLVKVTECIYFITVLFIILMLCHLYANECIARLHVYLLIKNIFIIKTAVFATI